MSTDTIAPPTLEALIAGSEQPVVVEFWAPWCGPCRAMAPVFEQVAGALGGKARFVKVNVDEQQALASRHGIRAIPTLVLFRGGAEMKRASGVLDAGALAQWIQS